MTEYDELDVPQPQSSPFFWSHAFADIEARWHDMLRTDSELANMARIYPYYRPSSRPVTRLMVQRSEVSPAYRIGIHIQNYSTSGHPGPSGHDGWPTPSRFPDYLIPSTSSGSSQFPPPQGTSDYRAYLYRYDLWAQPSESGRVRDCSPGFYRNNPAVTHRLQPFLNRELNALMPGRLDDCLHVFDMIMNALPEYSIRSRRFRRMIEPYTLENTDHFIHEFYSFARSTLDFHAYDRAVLNVPRQRLRAMFSTMPPVTTPVGIRFEDSDEDDIDVGRDTDVAGESASTRQERRKREVDVIDIVDSSDEDDRQRLDCLLTTQRNPSPSSPPQLSPARTPPRPTSPKRDPFSSPIPGPSGLRVGIPTRTSPRPRRERNTSSSDSDESIDVGRPDRHSLYSAAYEKRAQETQAKVKQDSENDSDSSIQVLDYEKPPPEMIDLSSDDDEGGNEENQNNENEQIEQSASNKRKAESDLSSASEKRLCSAVTSTPPRSSSLRSVVVPSSSFDPTLLANRRFSWTASISADTSRSTTIRSVVHFPDRPTLLSNMEDYDYEGDDDV